MTFIRARWLAVAALVCATLSGPAEIGAQAPPLCDPAMLVFDASGSMKGTRIVEARRAARDVLPALAKRREVGLVTYGAEPQAIDRCVSVSLRLAPVRDAAPAILEIIDRLEPSGSTPLTDAVRQAAELLAGHADRSVIVLITDGEENCGGNPCLLGDTLRRTFAGLTVHVIGYRLRIQEGSNLACLAERTNGRYAEVNAADELATALTATLGCAFVSDHRSPAPTLL